MTYNEIMISAPKQRIWIYGSNGNSTTMIIKTIITAVVDGFAE
jgi:hypothetical protein